MEADNGKAQAQNQGKEGQAVTIISEFLKVAKGQHVWVNIVDCDGLYEGKIESHDANHMIISSELGFDCIRIDWVIGISLPKQVEIIAE